MFSYKSPDKTNNLSGNWSRQVSFRSIAFGQVQRQYAGFLFMFISGYLCKAQQLCSIARYLLDDSFRLSSSCLRLPVGLVLRGISRIWRALAAPLPVQTMHFSHETFWNAGPGNHICLKTGVFRRLGGDWYGISIEQIYERRYPERFETPGT